MKVIITNFFKRSAKKLHKNQAIILKENIRKIIANPNIGKVKIADLTSVMVYKFHVLHQLILLAYTYNEAQAEIALLYFASHENFYKDLKNQIKN